MGVKKNIQGYFFFFAAVVIVVVSSSILSSTVTSSSSRSSSSSSLSSSTSSRSSSSSSLLSLLISLPLGLGLWLFQSAITDFIVPNVPSIAHFTDIPKCANAIKPPVCLQVWILTVCPSVSISFYRLFSLYLLSVCLSVSLLVWNFISISVSL